MRRIDFFFRFLVKDVKGCRSKYIMKLNSIGKMQKMLLLRKLLQVEEEVLQTGIYLH